VRFLNALHLYRVRLRARRVQELLAVVGIAAGVALLFASQISTSSLQSSVGELSRGIVGRATLQLVARDPHGFPQTLLSQVRQIPGVRIAAPLLEVNAAASGPRGSTSVELIGADPSLASLDGTLVPHANLTPFGNIGAVALPDALSRTIGVRKFGQEVTFQLLGHSARVPLYQVLSRRQIGALASSPVAIAPVSTVQEVTGLTGRVSRILVQVSDGRGAQVRAALTQLAAGHLNVENVTHDEQLFAKAAEASEQSTRLFAVISALVGFLFAFNAMLLTVPQRRRLIADLRRDGYTPRVVIAVLLLDGVVLGLFGCTLGLLLGDELSIHILRSDPAFLSLAFAIGSQRIVTPESIAIAAGGGMLAALVAVLSPLRDILSRDPLAALHPTERRGRARSGGRRALAGLACLLAATVTLLLDPDAAIPGMVLLVAALLLELPLALSATLLLVQRLARRFANVVPHVATMELSASRARAVAIAATGAVAVFGSVAIAGAHRDLLAGLDAAARDSNAFTDVWVAPAGSYNLLDTTPFAPLQQAALARLPGVRAVGIYRSGLLDWGERRVLVSAPPRGASPLLPVDQLLQGDPRTASARVAGGGWLVLSAALAAAHHLKLGDAFTLPSPNPTRLRVAALSSNLGWAPGAIVMNAADYAHAWDSSDASAYSVLLAAGVSPTRGAREIAHAIGRNSGLHVETAAQHTARQAALSREALARLTQIATLILLVAVLAMAAAIGAMVWQRRPRLAKLKLEGLPRAELWHTILLESLLLLGVGCFTGAIFGLYGQQLADRALANTINFPVVYSITAVSALRSLALVIAAALAVLAIPGYLAASVPAALALQD
jgi:putative ABC transport system permease protein